MLEWQRGDRKVPGWAGRSDGAQAGPRAPSWAGGSCQAPDRAGMEVTLGHDGLFVVILGIWGSEWDGHSIRRAEAGRDLRLAGP